MVIHKFPINTLLVVQKVAFSPVFQVLSLQMQNGTPFLWVLINPSDVIRKIDIFLFETGQEFPYDAELFYLGTFQTGGGMVLHAFGKDVS